MNYKQKSEEPAEKSPIEICLERISQYPEHDKSFYLEEGLISLCWAVEVIEQSSISRKDPDLADAFRKTFVLACEMLKQEFERDENEENPIVLAA